MSIKDQIRQEIERRRNACLTKNGFPAGLHCAMRIEAYEGLLSFIDSLPDESRDMPRQETAYINHKVETR